VTEDLGPSWLTGTPDGAVVARREIREGTVTAVFDGFFSARVRGERRRDYVDLALVSDRDAPLVRPGARFWLVIERVRLRGHGRPEVRSALAFRRPGALSPERAFATRRENTHA